MLGRITLLSALIASLMLSGAASADGSRRDAAIAGVLVGAVIGGAIVANSRYEHAPLYVEIGPPPPRVIYYQQPHSRYYSPPPVYYRPYQPVLVPHHFHRPHHYKHRHHKHYRRHHHHGHYEPRW
ncbi:hypothetical protein LPB260_23460 [Pseudomonas sp. LPB0260]|uniref:hypothetical protein n=1 Tax=Pseudomonas sp. LPB0260 TaxID=2614442 RepID=UPI0015C1CEDF|nr:hypothetical protein [Pseudomonas sp. LPB0260]QLC73685.1 hypothetical protein LPB260_08510 [Pseudomonas sp. LPB0260]QLC76459.1 hypothetical protein LPB260_23460 [Pseudomonas sp. LPB0260]